MKKRPDGFLAKDKIDHDGEIFDYIKELHDYLWQFVRKSIPGASGQLEWYIDDALAKLPPPAVEKWVDHIFEDGSRQHVLKYSEKGTTCSEPNCILNKPKPTPDKCELPLPEKISLRGLDIGETEIAEKFNHLLDYLSQKGR